MASDGLRVYVSGAISGLPLDEARAMFRAACDLLAAKGYDTVNPFDVPRRGGCSCPADPVGHEWGCHLRADIMAMLDCDAIYMLPGWERSHGARLELTVASAVGLRVHFARSLDGEQTTNPEEEQRG